MIGVTLPTVCVLSDKTDKVALMKIMSVLVTNIERLRRISVFDVQGIFEWHFEHRTLFAGLRLKTTLHGFREDEIDDRHIASAVLNLVERQQRQFNFERVSDGGLIIFGFPKDQEQARRFVRQTEHHSLVHIVPKCILEKKDPMFLVAKRFENSHLEPNGYSGNCIRVDTNKNVLIKIRAVLEGVGLGNDDATAIIHRCMNNSDPIGKQIIEIAGQSRVTIQDTRPQSVTAVHQDQHLHYTLPVAPVSSHGALIQAVSAR